MKYSLNHIFVSEDQWKISVHEYVRLRSVAARAEFLVSTRYILEKPSYN